MAARSAEVKDNEDDEPTLIDSETLCTVSSHQEVTRMLEQVKLYMGQKDMFDLIPTLSSLQDQFEKKTVVLACDQKQSTLDKFFNKI